MSRSELTNKRASRSVDVLGYKVEIGADLRGGDELRDFGAPLKLDYPDEVIKDVERSHQVISATNRGGGALNIVGVVHDDGLFSESLQIVVQSGILDATRFRMFKGKWWIGGYRQEFEILSNVVDPV